MASAASITASQIFVEGMTSVITGASSGIGRATAMFCAGKGMNVWMVDNDKEELDAAKELVLEKCSKKDSQVRDYVTLLFQFPISILIATHPENRGSGGGRCRRESHSFAIGRSV